jgi:hypothetical protein
MSDKLEEAIRRERLGDQLRALQYANAAQLPGETYEENLKRRATMRLRQDEILRELYS